MGTQASNKATSKITTLHNMDCKIVALLCLISVVAGAPEPNGIMDMFGSKGQDHPIYIYVPFGGNQQQQQGYGGYGDDGYGQQSGYGPPQAQGGFISFPLSMGGKGKGGDEGGLGSLLPLLALTGGGGGGGLFGR